MPRTIRKPVPQTSTCKKCGHDFKYMRTMGPRKYCDGCVSAKNSAHAKKWQARQRE